MSIVFGRGAPQPAPATSLRGRGSGAASGGPVFAPALGSEDRRLILALAAQQIRYGHPEEAIAFLMAMRKSGPGDPQTVKLLAAALIKAAHWAEAEVILGELSALVPRSTRISALYRSLIAFHLSRLSEASAWFAKFTARARDDDEALS